LNSEPTVHFDPSVFLSTPREGLVIKKYENGAVIFAQGDAAQDIFYIQAGQANITVVSELGKEAVIGILSADHFLGEAALNGQRIRLSSATAIEDCTIVQLSRAETLRILEKEPKFSEFFIQHLLSRNLRIEEDLVDQLFNSSEKRLARILLLLANFGKEGKPETVIPDITQETLAEMVGTHSFQGQFFHEQISEAWFHRVQWKIADSFLIAQRCPPRLIEKCRSQASGFPRSRMQQRRAGSQRQLSVGSRGPAKGRNGAPLPFALASAKDRSPP